MNNLKNEAPQELVEMFHRRERDVAGPVTLPTPIRRRIRTRQTMYGAGLAIAAVLAATVLIRLQGPAEDRTAHHTTPPPFTRGVAVHGHTDIFRWRVRVGDPIDGKLPTLLETSSLSGGGWYRVDEAKLAVQPEGEFASFLAAGVFADRPNEMVVWGAFAPGVDGVVVDPGTPCSGRGGRGAPIELHRGDAEVWAASVECGDHGTITEVGADGATLSVRPLGAPIPSDVWSITTTNVDGAGWILHRLVDSREPGGVALGDAGIPNDLRYVVDAGGEHAGPIAWKITPSSTEGRFVFGILTRDVARILIVSAGGHVEATTTSYIEDPYDIFWAKLPAAGPQQLVAFDDSCHEVFRATVVGTGAVDVPRGLCSNT